MNKKMIVFSVVMIFPLFIGMNQNLGAQGLEQDSLALVALYNSTDGANWTNNTNWLAGQVSTWYGITVSGGRVTQVNLGTNNLVGTIPPEIGNLTHLDYLELSNNQLSDSIPPEIANLMNLEYLYLGENQLSGSFPTEICNLTNLLYLFLGNNQLLGSFPAEIGNLTNLMSLYLSDNQLSGSIPPEIGNLTMLRYLYLGDNQLTLIPPEIRNLTNLMTLELSNNQLSGSIPPEIGNLANLEYLDLSSNQLSDSIPPEIWNMTNLTFLTLHYNQLSGSIPPEIGNLTNLLRLRLHNNQLTGSIPPEVWNLTNLTYLMLNSNQLSGSIPSEIGNLTNLEYLYLADNQFTGSIPAEIGNLVNLTDFDLSINQLSGAIPNAIKNLTKLRNLYLRDNRFKDLPDLSSISTLNDLNIRNNRFTFEDIEPNIGVPNFIYSPQDSVGVRKDTTLSQGSSMAIPVYVGGTANQYQWMKDGSDIQGATGPTYEIQSAVESDSGSYVCRITNTIATQLTLYRRPVHVTVTGGTGADDGSIHIPKEFALKQNYPNPFNPVTMIKFDLPKSCFVTLKVYNLLGKEIEILMSSQKQSGEYEVEWIAEGLPSGMYLYRLEAGEFVDVKKLILQR